MISRGTGTIKRVHARNFHHKQTNERLKEVVAPYQQQGLNALNVDSFEIYYYPYARSTRMCTCKEAEIIPEYGSMYPVPPTLVNQSNSNEIVLDYTRPLFGRPNENGTAQDEVTFDDLEIDEDNPSESNMVNSTFATNADCGICYRTGYVPGYNRYGRERIVLTTHDISNSYGYHMNPTNAPHTLDKTDLGAGYVEFTFDVPRYFQRVFYSVRNNVTILQDQLYDSTSNYNVLTFAGVKYSAGRSITVRVLAQNFTHVVLEFDLGTDPVLANMAQMSKTLDWTLFETLGNLSLNLPMTIPNIASSDIIYVPQRNITLKITDVTYLRTSKDSNLDWSCTTRVLQPQESVKHIARCNLLV